MAPTDIPSCSVCGDRTGQPVYLDLAGRGVCLPCYQRLRAGILAGGDSHQFRCNICGSIAPAARMFVRDDRLICAACQTGRTEAVANETPTSAVTATSAAAIDTAPVDELARARKFGGLLPKIVCPHCWAEFPPQDVLWISEHTDLKGDPVAGPDAQLRFLPSRFNVRGDAIDLRGVACQLLACPRCHLPVPRALTETPAIFIAIVGAPASGKSHFLTAMSWSLRRTLSRGFGVAFNDADGASNKVLQEYEEELFLPKDTKQLVLVRKTGLHGDWYDQVNIARQTVQLPKPLLFTLRPTERDPAAAGPHPAAGKPKRVRVLCLYDNAGEHFQPGMDSSTSPATQHLARARALMFLFDPTQHPRFREHCLKVSNDPQLKLSAPSLRQETILTETATRVRKYSGLSAQARHERPLIVILSKADIWAPLVKLDLSREPLLTPQAGGSWIVDVRRIEAISAQLRKVLMSVTPEFVTAAEDFCSQVIYIPVSSLGRGPQIIPETGGFGVPADEIHPRWVTAPLLYILSRWVLGLVHGNLAK